MQRPKTKREAEIAVIEAAKKLAARPCFFDEVAILRKPLADLEASEQDPDLIKFAKEVKTWPKERFPKWGAWGEESCVAHDFVGTYRDGGAICLTCGFNTRASAD